MAFNFYDTHTLLMSVKQLPPLHTFLLDRYFPTNAASDIFATDDVLVEYRKGSKKAAPFVAPRKGGITILRDGYTMKRFTPSYIAPKRPLTIDDLKKRGFGEALYPNLSPEQRQGVIMMGDLDELRNMNLRRKEAMAAEVIFTNGCIMDEYIDDLHNFEEREVRYYDGDVNPATYTPAADWDTNEASGRQMLNDVAAMISMLTSRGLPATEVLVSPDVADVVLANEWIMKLLDNRRYEMGGVSPELLPSGASKICRLNIKGRMIDFLSYEDTYTEVDGTVKPFIPAGMIAVCAPNAGRTVYGAITQVEQADGEFHTYAAVDVPKYLSDAAHNVRELMLSSAPLCMPNNENPFITAKVLNE
ncbi:MAG: major capsid protein [Enterocloster citroniae]|nr:major capsid protein [Enterocloster citroniae]